MNHQDKWLLQQLNKLETYEALLLSVSHDINNAMTIIKLEMEAFIEPGIKKKLDNITAALAALQSYSHKELERVIPCQLNDYIKKSHKFCEPFIKQHVTVESNLAPAIPLIHANPPELQQIVVNLILNAVKAMEKIDKQRKLSVSTQLIDEEVFMLVENNGDSDLIEDVHHPSMLMNPAMKSKLGLIVSRNLVEKANGTFQVESLANHGQRVIAKFPVIGY